MWTVVAAGIASCIYASYTLPRGNLDVYFLLLLLTTAVIGSRIAIRIPQINVNITVDDTFVFIALLHYGGEAAVLAGPRGCLRGIANQSQGQNSSLWQRRVGLLPCSSRQPFSSLLSDRRPGSSHAELQSVSSRFA